VEHGIIRDVMASLRWSLNLNRGLHISLQGYKKSSRRRRRIQWTTNGGI